MVELQTLLLGVNCRLDILKFEPFSNRILLAQEIDRAIGGEAQEPALPPLLARTLPGRAAAALGQAAIAACIIIVFFRRLFLSSWGKLPAQRCERLLPAAAEPLACFGSSRRDCSWRSRQWLFETTA